MPNKEQDDLKSLAQGLFNAEPMGAAFNAARKAGQAVESVAKTAQAKAQQTVKAVSDWETRTRKRMGY